MSRQSDSIKDAIKAATPIVDLVAEYLPLHRTGNTYKALCPFHDDHNPSLTLNSEHQSYKCWSCGAGGDVFSFVMAFERIDFPQAVRMLAERAGIALAKEPVREDGPKGPSKTDLLAVCAWAETTFANAFTHSPTAYEYVTRRGITSESIARFKIGYAPDVRDWLINQATSAGHRPEVLEKAGLLKRKEDSNLMTERFRGRLIFPIHDTRSRPIAFGGRILPESEKKLADAGLNVAKYLNSPETLLFQKRKVLFAADLARTAAKAAGWVAVVEGYTDVIAAHQAGLQNVVGVLGTALGDDHVKTLHALADRVVLIFDGDAAGQNAVERSLELFLRHEVDVRVLTLPDKLDPAEFLAKAGADELRRRVDRAVDPLDFIVDSAAGRYDLHSPEGARLAAQSVLSVLAKVPKTDQHGLDLKVAKALDNLSRRLGVSISDLKRELRRASKPRINRSPSEPLPTPEVSEKSEVAPIDPATLDRLDLEVLRIALNEPDSVAILQREVPSDALRDACLRGILQSCYDALADGEYPEFSRISFRLGDRERAFAAGLLLPMDPAPMPDRVRPSTWQERLAGVVSRWGYRRWEDHQRVLKAALAEVNKISDPSLHAELLVELTKHESRKPRPQPK